MFRGDISQKSRNFWGYEVVNMKKEVIKRGLFGFPVGIAIGFVITIIISAFVGDGVFYPVTPEFAETVGTELGAVVLQTVFCGIMGSGFAMASVIWEIDSWSLAKQSGVYFLIASLVMLPIAYISEWMEHSVVGVLSYIGIFVAIFVSVWLIQYFCWKRKIKKMNSSLK